MSNATLPRSARTGRETGSRIKAVVVGLLAGWLALVVWLGVHGAFVAPPRTPPLPIAAGFLAPVLVFLLALATAEAFRRFVLGIDAALMLGVQAWRFAGFTFIALYVYGVLPGVFAWPAGLGDIAVGLTAPAVLVTLLRRPTFAASKLFLAWNAFGVLDLVTAVGVGAINTALAGGAGAAGSTSVMAQFPLVLIPAYLVPVFLMLHIAAFMQSRQARGG